MRIFFQVVYFLFARDLKINPKTWFSSLGFSGSHGDSILALKNGKADVVSVATKQLDRMVEKGEVAHEDFVILKKSELIPGSCFAALTKLPPDLKQAFQDALLSFNTHKEDLKKLQCGGYEKTDDKTYDIISRSKSFPRIRFYICPGVQKLYFCTAASPGYMQKYNFCTPPEMFRSTDYPGTGRNEEKSGIRIIKKPGSLTAGFFCFITAKGYFFYNI